MAITRSRAIDDAAAGPQRSRGWRGRKFLAARGMRVRAGEESCASAVASEAIEARPPLDQIKPSEAAWSAPVLPNPRGHGDRRHCRQSGETVRRRIRNARAEKAVNGGESSDKPPDYRIFAGGQGRCRKRSSMAERHRHVHAKRPERLGRHAVSPKSDRGASTSSGLRTGHSVDRQPSALSDRALADRVAPDRALRIEARKGGDALARLQRSREPGPLGNAPMLSPPSDAPCV
jgi:hypothetical protein